MLSVFLVLAAAATVWAAPPDSNCGVPAIAPNTKIVGGAQAKPNSWPWQIQITYYGQHFCGASIISSDWILSAAHCFKGFDASGFKFRAGRHYKDGSDPYEQSSAARNIINHESYNDYTMTNDVAVIRLSTPLRFTNQVKAVCLPSRTSSLPANTKVYVTGWGKLWDGGPESSTLQQVSVPIIDRTTCNSASYYYNSIYAGMICAGVAAGGKDACQADSGGPLVTQINGRWEQYGVVSWGHGCAAPYKPGVYTDVVYYNSWIRSKVTQIEREEEQVDDKFKPVPFGIAFREHAKKMVEAGEIDGADLPNAAAWLH